jgi:hypothetical protein
MLTLVEYVLEVPDSNPRLPGRPACLPAIQAQAHTLNQITLKHWQVYSLLLGSTLISASAPRLLSWRLAGGFSFGGSASADLQPP